MPNNCKKINLHFNIKYRLFMRWGDNQITMDVWQQITSKKFIIRDEIEATTHHRNKISQARRNQKGMYPVSCNYTMSQRVHWLKKQKCQGHKSQWRSTQGLTITTKICYSMVLSKGKQGKQVVNWPWVRLSRQHLGLWREPSMDCRQRHWSQCQLPVLFHPSASLHWPVTDSDELLVFRANITYLNLWCIQCSHLHWHKHWKQNQLCPSQCHFLCGLK
jgi:hypothetical protein